MTHDLPRPLTKTEIAPEGGYPPFGPWSRGIRVGQFVFVAGTGPLDAAGQLVGEGDIAAQTERTLENIKDVLETSGAQMSDVVRTTVWVADFNGYDQYNEVYERYFEPPYPARATVQSGLLMPGMLIEIDALAVIAEAS